MSDPNLPEGTTPEPLLTTEEGTPEQLGLFGSESNAPIQPTRRSRSRQAAIQTEFDSQRLDSYKSLVAALRAKKADPQGIAIAIGTIYKAGFGKATTELYTYFNLTTNSRAALPEKVLKILIVYELAAQRRVDRHLLQSQAQTDINRELAQQCRIATTIMRRALYWAERAERLESTSLLAEPHADYPLNS